GASRWLGARRLTGAIMVLVRSRPTWPPGRSAARAARTGAPWSWGIRDIFRDKPDGGGVISGSWRVTKRVTGQVSRTAWGAVVRWRRAQGRAGGRGTTVRGAGSGRGVPG